MKGKKVLNLLQITRPTLCSYIKKGIIKAKKMPNGFYEYDEESVYKLLGVDKRDVVVYGRVLTFKRNNKINDYFHKSTSYIVNQLVSESINTVIIGLNKDWKQDINMGSKNNQSFTSIPHTKFINQLKYKCRLKGINASCKVYLSPPCWVISFVIFSISANLNALCGCSIILPLAPYPRNPGAISIFAISNSS